MVNNNVPFPDSPMSGFLSFDDADDIRPNDQIEVRKTDTDEKQYYEVISIRESNEAYLYDHIADSLEIFSEQEVEELIEKDNTYLRTILNREVVPVENQPTDTLVFYSYAIENPELPGNNRAIQFGWAVENQSPLRDMPEFNETVVSLTWEDLREKASPDGELPELYETFSGEISDAVSIMISVAEFNSRKLYEANGEPTYDEELARRMERDAESIQNVSEGIEDIYV